MAHSPRSCWGWPQPWVLKALSQMGCEAATACRQSRLAALRGIRARDYKLLGLPAPKL